MRVMATDTKQIQSLMIISFPLHDSHDIVFMLANFHLGGRGVYAALTSDIILVDTEAAIVVAWNS